MAANVFVLILLASLLKISYETANKHGHMYGRNTQLSDQAEGNNASPNDDHCNHDAEGFEVHNIISQYAKLRLSFAGRFLADVSTYNNYRENFNISTFDPVKYPGWNPKGTGDFRLVDCKVTQVCLMDGHCNQEDRLVGQPIIGSNSTTTGKLVDLDTDDQTQSQLWGLVIGVAGFLKGNFQNRSFNHMHDACAGLDCATVSSMTRFSAVFMSTLENVTWSHRRLAKESNFIQQVLSLSCMPGFTLHVKLNLHNMIVVSKSSDFPYGRVVGTIYATVPYKSHPYGPYKRMLWSKEGGHVPFYVDPLTKNVVLDFANSVKFDIKGNLVDSSGGRMYLLQYNRTKRLTCEFLYNETHNLGELKLGGNNWFQTTAGIIDLSVKHKETETTEMIKYTPLAVVIKQDTPTSCVSVWEEREDGLFVGSVSNRVMRKEPKDKWDMTFRTFKYGSPAGGVSINAKPKLSDDPTPPISIDAPVSESDADGFSTIHFQANDPGKPRSKQQLDGQIYSYDIFAKKDTENEFKVEDLMVSIHLYSDCKVGSNATWYDHVYPIFQMYANLYPSMKQVIDLASYEDVTRKRKLIKYALSLHEDDPNHMPVTRDLSPKKRKMILSWLENPLLGTANYTLDELKRTLQVALQLELATIPPYLSALFSIKDGDNKGVAALIGSVVVDEMKHMALVSNLLNAIGGSPVLNHPSVVPSYPAPLPGGANPGLVVKLARCSLNQIRTVFQWIERPDCEMVNSALAQYLRTQNPRKDSPTNSNGLTQLCQSITTRPQTIGAIYIHQILCPMATLEDGHGSTIFTGDITKQITSDHWFGDNSDAPNAVTNLTSAVSAIQEITKEGEGSHPCDPFNEGELSHFFKFAEVVHGRKLVEIGSFKLPSGHRLDNFYPCDEDKDTCNDTFGFVGQVVPFYEDGVWPTISNPHTDSYPPESQVRKYSDNFNTIYTGLLKCIHEAFNGNPNKMKDCMGMMSSLKAWGKRLVQTPIDPNGNPEIGPNAAPTFQFHDTND